MTVIRYEPWSVLNQLHGQINRIFDGSEWDRGAASSAATADWIPAADIDEHADRFVLKLDVPGIDVAAIDITLDKGVLSVSGERARDAAANGVQRSRSERPHGRFYRRFTLPDTVRCCRRACDGTQRHRRGYDSEAAEGATPTHPGRQRVEAAAFKTVTHTGWTTQVVRLACV